jgi:hypothetical protein
MTHYFIDFGYSTATKNKPQHEAHEYLKSLHGKLIIKEKLADVQKIIQEKLKTISGSHPRCKPIEVEFSERLYRTGDKQSSSIWMKGFEAVNFKFEPATLTNPENLKNYVPPQ